MAPMSSQPLAPEPTPGSSSSNPEALGRFAGFIGPANLVAWLRGSVPYLFDGSHPRTGECPPATPGSSLLEQAQGALGWWRCIRSGSQLPATESPEPAAVREYFVLCCAAHWASVASYVPTDVDAKIRRALWSDQPQAEELEAMLAFALRLPDWSVLEFSQRLVRLPTDWGLGDCLSGHAGELLSVWGGALCAFVLRGDARATERLDAAIDGELRRQSEAFLALGRTPGREVDWLRAAAILTHNAGDLNQGLEELIAKKHPHPALAQFERLAQAGPQRYGGAFAQAAEIYRICLASEGHRHYPLRAAKGLRRSADLGLPIAPFLDDWGRLVATHPLLNPAERAEVVQALLDGLRRVPGQMAYQRALRGFAEAHPRGLDDKALQGSLSAAARRALKDSALLKDLAVAQRSFESGLVRRARQAVASL